MAERITLFRCAGNERFRRETGEPAMEHVTWRCGDGARNTACDCEPVEFVPRPEHERLRRAAVTALSAALRRDRAGVAPAVIEAEFRRVLNGEDSDG